LQRKIIKNRMNKIKQILLEQGRSQVWLAKQLRVEKNIVNRYCNNKTQPSLKKLSIIAILLNVNIKDLIV